MNDYYFPAYDPVLRDNYPYRRSGLIPKKLPDDGNRFWKVTTEPTTEPLTINKEDEYDVKWFGRIDGKSEDTLIEGFIKSVRKLAEDYLGRALIEQEITMEMDFWPVKRIVQLPRPNLLSVTKVVTVDEDDTETEYSSDNYYIDTISTPGRLILRQNVTAPQNTDRDYSGYRIVFKAGYGSSREDVPQSIIEGLKLWVMNAYEKRQISKEPPPDARPWIDSEKIIRI